MAQPSSGDVNALYNSAQKDGTLNTLVAPIAKPQLEPVTGIKVLGFGAHPGIVEKLKHVYVNEFKFDPSSTAIVVADETHKPALIAALKQQKWDVVVIGHGIASHSLLLVYVLNAVATLSPGTRIALPDDPTDVQQAVARAWREKYE
eukprot:Phypoly_transcript_24286.p1 GENE.Phypoly_transcript_24286~~Phypoly_transcript_24286.p1  ORF type:complete len:147 (+),score=39.07 Phypoly_transcript_24286:63-503(+)